MKRMLNGGKGWMNSHDNTVQQQARICIMKSSEGNLKPNLSVCPNVVENSENLLSFNGNAAELGDLADEVIAGVRTVCIC